MAPRPWLVPDSRFPECRNIIDSRTITNDSQAGLTKDGHAIPGILDIGNLLGAGSFVAEDMANTAALRANPSTAADIIVTVLYQHRPSLLREFFDSRNFTYVHSLDERSHQEAGKQRRNFVISRHGEQITAGFCDQDTPETELGEWVSYVSYTIIEHSRWRQDRAVFPQNCLDVKRTLKCDDSDLSLERRLFEQWASFALQDAIKQRRWFKQPGARIEIKSGIIYRTRG